MIARNLFAYGALAGAIALLALAGARIDMQDAMAKCQTKHSFSTCHSGLYR